MVLCKYRLSKVIFWKSCTMWQKISHLILMWGLESCHQQLPKMKEGHREPQDTSQLGVCTESEQKLKSPGYVFSEILFPLPI